jgi:hypothetical protein
LSSIAEPGAPRVARLDTRCVTLERSSGFDNRLRACHLAIGIDHLGYNAFMNRWDDLATLAEYFERFVDS